MAAPRATALSAALLLGAALLGAAPAAAADAGFAEARQALRQGDHETARAIWSALAEEGEAEAQFGLGLLHDLGLGMPADPERAYRWYAAAARQGHPEAQLNVAIMREQGIGVPVDAARALVWYSRAAASGQDRARYNLGEIYRNGDIAARDLRLAGAWYAAAGTLPAAQERLRTLPDPGAPTPVRPPRLPEPLIAPVPGERDAWRAMLTWIPGAADTSALYRVQLARLGVEGVSVLHAEDHALSAVEVELPRGGEFAWRVIALAPDGEGHAASPWRRFGAGGNDAGSHGEAMARLDRFGLAHVAIRHHDDDAYAAAFARELAADLGRSGLPTEIAAEPEPVTEETLVRFFHVEDRAAARQVADFLPVLVGEAERGAADGAPAPGTIEILLKGGVAPEDAPGGGDDIETSAQTPATRSR